MISIFRSHLSKVSTNERRYSWTGDRVMVAFLAQKLYQWDLVRHEQVDLMFTT